jgi:hypothetical protein
MFLKNSRYINTETLVSEDVRNRLVQAIKLRRLPSTSGNDLLIDNSHQLDIMSKKLYKDGSKFWHITDANSELEANALLKPIGRVIKVPKV